MSWTAHAFVALLHTNTYPAANASGSEVFHRYYRMGGTSTSGASTSGASTSGTSAGTSGTSAGTSTSGTSTSGAFTSGTPPGPPSSSSIGGGRFGIIAGAGAYVTTMEGAPAGIAAGDAATSGSSFSGNIPAVAVFLTFWLTSILISIGGFSGSGLTETGTGVVHGFLFFLGLGVVVVGGGGVVGMTHVVTK